MGRHRKPQRQLNGCRQHPYRRKRGAATCRPYAYRWATVYDRTGRRTGPCSCTVTIAGAHASASGAAQSVPVSDATYAAGSPADTRTATNADPDACADRHDDQWDRPHALR